MYIKDIILDGFKSYQKATKISDFDPQFNAITGLNGSGKSNVLDAICFVMGISALKHIRAEKKQELIYKGGTSGITKASVTISFDNTDKSRSPTGYEQFDTISVTQTIEGQMSKYYINSKKETMEKIRNLFCSVKLNVNNPHFLIMQGRVTKVTNMKPMELLGLIEEAAGTSLYQTKKEQAENHLKKKELKLQEVNHILNEDVKSKLDKLNKDKALYDNYRAKMAECEQREKIMIAYKYFSSKNELENSKQQQLQERNQIGHYDNEITKREAMEQQIKHMQKQFEEKNLANDQSIKMAEKELNKQEITIIQIKEEIKNAQKVIDDGNQLKQKMSIESAKLEGEHKDNTYKIENLKKTDLQEEIDKTKDRLLDAEDLLQKFNSNQGSQSNTTDFIKNLVSEAENKLQNHKNKCQQINLQIGKEKMQLQQSNDAYNRLKSEFDEGANNKGELQRKVEYTENEIKKIGDNDRQTQDLKKEADGILNIVNRIKSEMGQLNVGRQIDFFYQFPQNYDIQNFPKDLIYGRLGTLFKIKDTYAQYETALQVIAGGQKGLQKVVVAKHTICRDLLHFQALRQHESFIPLDKINPRSVDSDQVEKIKRMTGNKVFLATELIEFDPKFQKVMDFVFGQTFVAQNQETAKQVTLGRHPGPKFNTVTLLGDSYRTDGILSGGKIMQPVCLKKIENYMDLKKQLTQKSNEKHIIDQKNEQFRQKSEVRDRLTHELSILKHRLNSQNESGDLQSKVEIENQKIERHKSKIDELESLTNEMKEKETELVNDKKEADDKLREISQDGNSKGKQETMIKKEVSKLREQHENLKIQQVNKTTQISKMEIQIETDQKNREQILQDLDSQKKKEPKQYQLVESLNYNLTRELKVFDGKKEQFRANNEARSKQNNEIQQEVQKLENIAKQITDLKIAREQTKQNVENQKHSEETAKKLIVELQRDHVWLSASEPEFNKPNSNFDFRNINIHDEKKGLVDLKNELQDMKKRVDFKVDAMLDDTNLKYDNLITKKATTEDNKKEVEETIEYLNGKKNEELNKIWKVVSQNFGDIFKTLLPGCQAKLALHKPDPSNPDKGVENGLCLRVAFGGQWKKSLSELSGGQRSLLALSLILALLKFQPAPIYILDEIDSALDQSHTQNIGLMIKQHFQNSQFIIVSLKQGLFSNANVLFNVKLQDKRSQVDRQAISHNR